MTVCGRFGRAVLAAAFGLLLREEPCAAAPWSQPGIDAPALAPLGPYPVGVRSISLVEAAAPDLAHFDKKTGYAPLADRALTVDVWYPSLAAPGLPLATYTAAIVGETPGSKTSFSTTGVARRDTTPDGHGPYPLVVMSHGFGGSPAVMTWLAENLASKGYVVAAPRHEDPAITDVSKFAIPLLFRPLDIAFTAHFLQSEAKRAGSFFFKIVDPYRVALVGYSMGGYGALTVAGCELLPSSAARAPGRFLTDYASGGPKQYDLRVADLKAVVAISPFGGQGPQPAWDSKGLASLRTPSLFIVGDQDHVVGYAPGVATIFNAAVHARRSMLVFEGAGHSIGMNGVPEPMRHTLWDFDWFEDPVWRKERLIEVNLHMITAFLDLEVKGDQTRAPYLNLIQRSSEGVWPDPAGERLPYGGYSPGVGDVTVWKGFQAVHVAGMEFRHLDAAP